VKTDAVTPPGTGGPLPPTPAPGNTYTWATGAWGLCSATACGTSGTQTRDVYCKRQDGVRVGDGNCSGSKPSSSKSCSAAACTYTYAWYTGNWGACSVTACGQTGTKSRTV